MSCWQIREVGGQGRLFTLDKEKPLTVGQANGSAIQLQLRNVEKKHAVVEWSHKKLSYVVKDLGTTSGTFINNAPLTRGTDELRHGDSLRFGHDKSQMFRVEENFSSVPSPAAQLPPTTTTTQVSSQGPSTAATQTSPQGVSQQTVPVNPPQPAVVDRSPAVSSVPPQGVLLPNGGYFIPGMQPGAILTPGGAVQYILPQTPIYPQPLPSPMPHTAAGYIQVSTPPPSSPVHLPAAPTLPVQDIEAESVFDEAPLSPKRTDGRRQVGLSNTPSMATNSRLYGQPAWWGEVEGPHIPIHNEFRHTPPGSQLLRDFDSDDASSVSSRTSKLSAKDGLRLKAISNSQEQSSTSSWVVDFNSSTKPRSLSKSRPRSADTSPIRTSTTNSISSASTTSSLSRKTQSTFVKHRSPVSTKESSGKVIATRPHSFSLTRSATTRKTTPSSPLGTRKSTMSATTRKKSGSLSDISSKTSESKDDSDPKQSSIDSKTRKKSGSLSNIASKPADSTRTKKLPKTSPTGAKLDSKTRKKSGSTSDISGKNHRSIVEKTYTKIGGQGSSDELQTSMSDLSLTADAGPVVVGEGVICPQEDDTTEGSGRKQWSKEVPIPDGSLILANIEARLRQLSRLAQGSAVKLTAKKRDLQEMGVVSREDTPHICSFNSADEQRVPQWKFAQNKEVHSIFKSMKSVEKWLIDIESTVASLHLLPKGGVATDKEGLVVEEGVDFDPRGSEMECYQDSIEDNFASCSESAYSD